jgi:hypothetical protein
MWLQKKYKTFHPCRNGLLQAPYRDRLLQAGGF